MSLIFKHNAAIKMFHSEMTDMIVFNSNGNCLFWRVQLKCPPGRPPPTSAKPRPPICSQCPNDLLQLVSEAFIFSPSYFSCRSTSTPRPWIQQEAKALSGRNWGILSCTRLVMCTILALDALSTMHYVAILARKALTLPPGQFVDGAICINFYQNLAHLPSLTIDI